MKTKDIIRAWKDAGYRQNLSEADRAKLPAHPAGMIELTDADLGVVSGGMKEISRWDCLFTWQCR